MPETIREQIEAAHGFNDLDKQVELATAWENGSLVPRDEHEAHKRTMFELGLSEGFTKGMKLAAGIARQGCLVSPDGGSPTDDEVRMCKDIAAAIRKEISS